jgi:hypothetical protein
VFAEKLRVMETQYTALRAAAINFEVMVQRLYMEESGVHANESTIEGVIRMHFAQLGTTHEWKRETFFRLLMHLSTKRCYAVLRNPAFIEVLAHMSAFGTKMVRPVEDWVKDSLTAEGQLASMIRHCFAKYDVPQFMEYVFASGNTVHMFWYIQLGRGDSVQKLAAFPVQFTNKMAHAFRETPAQYTVEQAIRRAQAIGFGANAQTAEAIAWSATIEEIVNAGFRAAVISFIAKVKETPAFDRLQQVIEFLAAMHVADNAYSLRGRTWVSVSRQAAEYHAELAKKKAAESFSDWVRSTIKDYEVEKESGIFKIVQLDTSEALYEEGHEMSHCVAEYAYDCTEGGVAIFSLRRFAADEENFERLATIEVQLAYKEIVQAKAEYNEMISEEANDLILEWAKAEGLKPDYEYYDPAEYMAPAVQPQAQPAIQLPQAIPGPAQQRQYEPPVDYYRPYRPESDVTGTDIVKIIMVIIKVLWLVAKCSQSG